MLQFCPCNLEFHMARLGTIQGSVCCNFYLCLVYALCTHFLPRDITVCLGHQCNSGPFEYHGVCVRHVSLSSSRAHDRALLHCLFYRSIHMPVTPWPRDTAQHSPVPFFISSFTSNFVMSLFVDLEGGADSPFTICDFLFVEIFWTLGCIWHLCNFSVPADLPL